VATAHGSDQYPSKRPEKVPLQSAEAIVTPSPLLMSTVSLNRVLLYPIQGPVTRTIMPSAAPRTPNLCRQDRVLARRTKGTRRRIVSGASSSRPRKDKPSTTPSQMPDRSEGRLQKR
jgi:hypothetical protein